MDTSNLPAKLGHYTLCKFLDKGGMGEVFLATDDILQRQVAIKLLKNLHYGSIDRRKRFLSEARAIAALNHPNIVVVHEIGYLDEDSNTPFIVMEYVDGVSLENLLIERIPSAYEAVEIALQIAEGLHTAHQNRIVHRDIKPSNLMITRDGRVKILDFGLSKLIFETSSEASTQIKNTADGVIVGTIPYLSPEQALGQKLDGRSDIFSFGIVLYRMLTGRHPFPGNNAVETTTRIVTQSPEKWPDEISIPQRLKRLVMKCLMKSPSSRYQTMGELIEDLKEIRSELQNSSQPQSRSGQVSAQDETVCDIEPVVLATSAKPTLWHWIPLGAVIIVVIAVALLIWNNSRSKRPQEWKISQITNSMGLDIYPSFSPDGKSIAYCSDRTGTFEIYIRQFTPGGREVQLTSNGEQNFQPAWSPDGSRIAYHSSKQRGIWVIPSFGGSPKQITDFGSRPAWSPDGSTIVFQSDGLIDLAANASPAMPPSTIWLVSTQGGQPRQLTRVGEPTGGHGTPNWSPDGKHIVFASYDRRNSAIWSVPVEGGGLVRIVFNQRYIYDPIYSPDGSSIIYCALSASGDYGMWKIRVNASSKEPQGEPEQLANLGLGTVRHLAMSKDGNRVLYSGLSMMSNLVATPVNLAGEVTGRSVTLTSETGRNSRPIFSPDASKIAFEKWQAGLNPDIWIVNSNGSNPIQITTDPAVDSVPNWYPEGDRLLFRTNRSGNAQFWSVVVSSGKESKVLDIGRDVDYARLSPNGKYLAYNSTAGGNTINVWLIDLQTGERRQLTFDKEMASFPCWSPDSKSLAIQFKRGDNFHICVYSLETGQSKFLTKGHGQYWSYSWSPDGDKIAYAGFKNNFWNIWWISSSTGQEKQITAYEKMNAYVRYPAWSPQGDRIVFEYAETTGNVWMIENVSK